MPIVKYYRRDNCPPELDRALTRLEQAEHRLVSAKTADELETAIRAVDAARNETGKIYLEMDKKARPWMYKRGRRP